MRRVNQLTYDGDELIRFMLEAVLGEYPDTKFRHRQQVARNAAPQRGETKSPRHSPEALSGFGSDG